LNEFQAKLPIASFTNKSYVAVNIHRSHLLLTAVLLWIWIERRPSLLQQSGDIACPLGSQQQTRRTLLWRANGTDRRIDGRTPYRFIDPAPHTTPRTVPIMPKTDF